MQSKLTLDSIIRYTRRAGWRVRAILELADEIRQDKRRAARLLAQECAPCFYEGGLAGQACTKFACQNCSEQHQHSNTRVPAYCSQCATDFHVCRRCGCSLAGEPQ
jgi:hypothetical protein